jgi:hypothetical protein
VILGDRGPADESQDDHFSGNLSSRLAWSLGSLASSWVVFGQSDLLPSLSGYHHSDMRNWFVGSKAVFWGETIAVLAFGLSWILNGSELFNILLVEHGRPPVLREPAPNEPALDRSF